MGQAFVRLRYRQLQEVRADHPRKGGHASGVNAGAIPQDLVVLAEPPQDRFVNTLPNPGLHPVMKATPACHAATVAALTRQILPRNSGPENEQDSRQDRSV